MVEWCDAGIQTEVDPLIVVDDCISRKIDPRIQLIKNQLQINKAIPLKSAEIPRPKQENKLEIAANKNIPKIKNYNDLVSIISQSIKK